MVSPLFSKWQEWVIWMPGDIWDLPTGTAKVFCSQQHLSGQVFPVQNLLPGSVLLPMPELASASGTAPVSLQGANFRGKKATEKKGGLLWIPPCSLWETAASSPDRASASSVCVSLELQPVAQKIPEAFGLDWVGLVPSFCGSLAQKLGSFGITSSQALGN